MGLNCFFPGLKYGCLMNITYIKSMFFVSATRSSYYTIERSAKLRSYFLYSNSPNNMNIRLNPSAHVHCDVVIMAHPSKHMQLHVSDTTAIAFEYLGS